MSGVFVKRRRRVLLSKCLRAAGCAWCQKAG